MDIDGLGYKIMIQLVERELVRTPADIFRLDAEILSLLSDDARAGVAEVEW